MKSSPTARRQMLGCDSPPNKIVEMSEGKVSHQIRRSLPNHNGEISP